MTTVPTVHDTVQHVVPFIRTQLDNHRKHYIGQPQSPPLFIGLNGVQGAGKSVLVSLLKAALESGPDSPSIVVLSLDDFYLTHSEQQLLADSYSDNPLLQHRGLPGTHDLKLALDTLQLLRENQRTKLPAYNKAAFAGQGDRAPETEWQIVNDDSTRLVEVVLFEGWSVGFRSITTTRLREKHEAAVASLQSPVETYIGRLAQNTQKSLATINNALEQYDAITAFLDAFIYLKAADMQFVYKWRLQQEAGLRAKTGSGMTDEQVKKFVDGYFPAYELYSDEIDKGVLQTLGKGDRKQMTMVIDENRTVQKIAIV